MKEQKYASILLVHYSLVDDYGGERAKRETKTRSEMMKTTIESILKNTEYPSELIVMDNGGNPDDSNYLLDLTRQKKITTYVRYGDNMLYAFAHNQAAQLATGEYLVFICNDVEVKKGWLSTCIKNLERYKNRRYIAAPLICSHKQDKYDYGTLDGNRINPLAGSNCMVMTRKVFAELGNFNMDSTYSNKWFIDKVNKGYFVIAPPEDLAIHLSPKGGLNWRRKVDIKKTLLNGTKIDFDEHNKPHHYIQVFQ